MTTVTRYFVSEVPSTFMKRLTAIIVSVAVVTYIAHVLYAIYADRALYADGSNFFVNLVAEKSGWPLFDDSKHMRLLVNLINQLPTSLALLSEIESLSVLRKLFGAGLFVSPIIAYTYCFYLSWRADDYQTFFLSICSLVTCAMPSEIFIVNQAFLALALFWILLHYLLLDLKLHWIDHLIMAVVVAILFRAHESVLFWGFVLSFASAATFYYRYGLTVTHGNLHVYNLGLVGLAQIAFVLYWQISHPVDQQTNAFLELTKLAAPWELWQGNTRISVLTALLVLVGFLLHQLKRPLTSISFVVGTAALGFGLLWSGIAPLINYDLTDPYREYSYRFLMTFGSTGWMLLAVVIHLSGLRINVRNFHLGIIALALGLLSATSWQLSNTMQWTALKAATVLELRKPGKPIRQSALVRQTLISEKREYAYKYRCPWAWSVFGMSLQKDGRVTRLFRPEPAYAEYFRPPKLLPFLDIDGNERIYSFAEFATDK